MPFQLGEDQRLCLGQPVGFGQLLDDCRLLFGELNAAARKCRKVFYGIVECLAQLYGGRFQITVQNGGKIEGYGLRPFEVIARNVGEGQKLGGDVIEDRLVSE